METLKQQAREEFDSKFTEHFTTKREELLQLDIKDFIDSLLDKAYIEGKKAVDENTSDGYHTFKELYEFRKLYNAGFFNALGDGIVHKSKNHSDGEECFGGGWFIVMATLPTGQISNHYELKDWDLFHCEERDMADKWDGHTAQDVADRLRKFLNQ